MRVSELIESLEVALDRCGDVPVEVSVDLSTEEDENTNGHRAFGSIYTWTTQSGKTHRSIVLCAEAGTLNFKP